MPKDWKKRWDQAIGYLKRFNPRRIGSHIGPDIGTHIEQLVPIEDKRKSISKEISVGSKPEEREALRALLLCQRVYYAEDTFAKASEGIGDQRTVTVLPCRYLFSPQWQKESVAFWGKKSEAEIRRAIAMFDIVPNAIAADLQRFAYAGKPEGQLPGNLKVSRADLAMPGVGFICYAGVCGWLVKSGIVSMRWVMQNANPNGRIGCNLLFGQGQELWRAPIKPENEADVRRICLQVPRGHIVHIWCVEKERGGWNGHWVVANGDGTVCGVNNAEFETDKSDSGRKVLKTYTNFSTLFEQFKGYGELDDELDTKGVPTGNKVWRTAVMVEIDPLQMPRM